MSCEATSSNKIQTNKEMLTETKTQYNNLKLQTNRYKFSKEVSELLMDFTKEHQYEKSKDYKESWNNWIKDDEIKGKLEEEVGRLVKEGMEGDVMDRLYKSSRYYYSKKIHKPTSTPVARKKYESMSKTILKEMDVQIIREINGNIDINDNEKVISHFTPSKSFEVYIKEKPEVLDELIGEKAETAEARRIQNQSTVDRLKKIYKNRFYKIKVSLEK
jgi:hypothetical protein